MFFHPANFLFFLLLILSTLLIISSNSWIIIWLCLEINVLVFIPLIFKKSSKYQKETAIKYFIVQAMASVILLLSLVKLYTSSASMLLLTSALLLKLGAAPLHLWVPALVEGLSWKNFFLLMTLQKMSPILVLSMNKMTVINSKLFYIFIWCGAFIGAISGLIQSSMRKILTFSSVNHMSWILVAILMSKSLWMFYFIIYTFIMFTIILTMKKNNLNKLSNMFKKDKKANIFSIVNFLSLGGLPPFTGFFPKFLVVSKMMASNFYLCLIPIISGSLISLFFYLRIAFNSFFFFKTTTNTNNPVAAMSSYTPLIFNVLGFCLMMFMYFYILDFKLKKL